MEDDLELLESALDDLETEPLERPAEATVKPNQNGGRSAAAKRQANVRNIPCVLIKIGKCDQMQKRGSRFCHVHNCHWEAMLWQASQDSPETKKLFVTAMKDDLAASTEVEKYARENAGVGKHKRKGLRN